jgi:hypothetical protein
VERVLRHARGPLENNWPQICKEINTDKKIFTMKIMKSTKNHEERIELPQVNTDAHK